MKDIKKIRDWLQEQSEKQFVISDFSGTKCALRLKDDILFFPEEIVNYQGELCEIRKFGPDMINVICSNTKSKSDFVTEINNLTPLSEEQTLELLV